MRLTILTFTTILIGVASVQAAEKGKPLDDAQCKAAWTIVSPNGAAISKGQARALDHRLDHGRYEQGRNDRRR